MIPMLKQLVGFKFKPRNRRAAAAGNSVIPMRVYARLLDALRRRGHPKPDWQPPQRHLDGLGPEDRPLALCAADIIRIYYAAAYGARPPEASELAEAEAAISRLEADSR